MNKEKFCLRWNDFENNLSGAFRELRDDKDFFDVTLACDDEQIQAHKVIISACSPFFRNILRRNPHQHPLLYLNGVKYTDLQSVLNFMYHGEVNIAQEELNSFLAVAEDLKVKGLTQNQSGESQKTATRAIIESNQPSLKPPPHIAKQEKHHLVKHHVPISDPHDTPLEDDIQEVYCVPIKSEPLPQPAPVYPTPVQERGEEQRVETYQEDSQVYEDYGEYEDDQQYAEAGSSGMLQGFGTEKGKLSEVSTPDDLYMFCVKEPGQWRCGVCSDYTNNGRNHVRNHVESKHFPTTFQYQCPQCDKTSNTKKGMDVHKSKKHGNIVNPSVQAEHGV